MNMSERSTREPPSHDLHDTDPAAPTRRRYDSPVRREQAAETRQRIVAAGAALAHAHTTWDWRELTFRAVAEQAGVSERTVYRHFASQRELHDAVMARLGEEAGVSYDAIALRDLPRVTARVFQSLPSFRARPTVEVVTEDERRIRAVRDAVARRGTSTPTRRSRRSPGRSPC